MRKRRPYLYRRGRTWWLYDSNRRISLRTEDETEAAERLAAAVGGTTLDATFALVEAHLAKNVVPLGFVYFIGAEGLSYVKIGFARDLAHRLRELQCASPHELVVLVSFPGTLRTERELHARWAAMRHRGEWYRLEGDLASLLA